MTTHNLFERPELLDSQTRLILSADTKPKRLIRSATRSAGHHGTHERPDSAVSATAIQEVDNELLDENAETNNENFPIRQISVISNEADYDTDLEQEQESHRDYTCKGIYMDQCRRHSLIPSSHFLRHVDNQTLAIRYCGLKSINVKVMVPSLRINSTITKLDLQDNSIGSRGAIYIAYLIKDNEYIDELNLANNDIGLQGCKALCRVLSSNRSLRKINLDGNRFNDDCAPFFAEVFSQNEFLISINLNKNFFENESTGRLFGKALSENQTLEHFYIGWNCLCSKACGHLLKPLTLNARITSLDLSWNGAGLFAAKAMSELLRKHTVLEKLFLDNNKFNTECAAYIGKGLSKNESLKSLTLSGNPLESSGCYAVLRPLIKHSTCQLRTIDLRGIIVNKDFLELGAELATALPELTVRLARVGKSTLIRELSGDEQIRTSADLNTCTQTTTAYTDQFEKFLARHIIARAAIFCRTAGAFANTPALKLLFNELASHGVALFFVITRWPFLPRREQITIVDEAIELLGGTATGIYPSKTRNINKNVQNVEIVTTLTVNSYIDELGHRFQSTTFPVMNLMLLRQLIITKTCRGNDREQKLIDLYKNQMSLFATIGYHAFEVLDGLVYGALSFGLNKKEEEIYRALKQGGRNQHMTTHIS
ncbi:unnamed protein product [Rotaria magnacalcarata]|uniref:Uncharacterized protein n=2 Tax=Rotaria magnacalcarata TaxID=392030 RepID=A0A815YV40_9BILA|nr:unnamed protein product [Rotaria magnacalcarata]